MAEIVHQLLDSFSHYLRRGFIHPKWSTRFLNHRQYHHVIHVSRYGVSPYHEPNFEHHCTLIRLRQTDEPNLAVKILVEVNYCSHSANGKPLNFWKIQN